MKANLNVPLILVRAGAELPTVIAEEVAKIDQLLREAQRRQNAILRTLNALTNKGAPVKLAPVPKTVFRSTMVADDKLDDIVFKIFQAQAEKGGKICQTGRKEIFQQKFKALDGVSRRATQDAVARLLLSGRIRRSDIRGELIIA